MNDRLTIAGGRKAMAISSSHSFYNASKANANAVMSITPA